jgi:preprotein translocase subunit SecD
VERKLRWKVIFTVLLLALSVVAVLPSFEKLDIGQKPRLPEMIRNLFDGINLGLDLQGGLRLAYEVQVEAAVEDSRDRLAEAIVKDLAEKAEIKNVKIVPLDESYKFRLVFASETDRASSDTADVLTEFRESVIIESQEGAVINMTLVDSLVESKRKDAVTQAKKTIKSRLNEMLLPNTSVAEKDIDLIVEIPGIDDKLIARIKHIIGTTARLQFKIVDEGGSKFFEDNKDKLPKDDSIILQREKVNDGDKGVVWSYYLEAKDNPKTKETGHQILKKFVDTLDIPGDRSVGYNEKSAIDAAGNPTGVSTWRTFYMDRTAGLTGESVDTAGVRNEEDTGKPYVSLTFDQAGASSFGELTGANVHRRMAIELDNVVQSAPTIQEKIPGGNCKITLGYGDYNKLFYEAKDLALVLRAGALPAPINLVNESMVGPALGQDSIDMGKWALIIGFGLVVLFMLFYYQVGGIAADIALIANTLFIFGTLSGFGATLTLPGIAGIILTIGMAVDANVIIYERIREELKTGKSPRAAVDAGYSRAFWTIFDAQITTLIAGVVMYQYGTGDIKGFAVTLLIGIVTSMFSSIYISRIVLDLATRRRAEHLSI